MTRALLILSALALGCGTSHETRMRVIVDSELAAPAEIDTIDISVDSRAVGGGRRTASVNLVGGATLPGTLGVTHQGTAATLGPIRIEAMGTLSGAFVAADAADATFIPGEEVIVRLVLRRDCIGVECGPMERCEAGGCVAVGADAGVADASVPDGGAFDAGPTMCVEPLADCTAAAGCETDLESDPLHCGGCGVDCGVGAQVADGTCAAGVCSVSSCEGDFEDCNADFTDGCEVRVTTDVAHCNDCGRDCPSVVGSRVATTRCRDGECEVATCEPGYFDCDGEGETGCECASGCAGDNCR